jgi:hypothetical protein
MRGSEEETRLEKCQQPHSFQHRRSSLMMKFSGSDPQDGSFVEVMSPGTPGGWQKGMVATRKGEFSVVYFPDGQRRVVEREEMRPLGADTAAYATDVHSAVLQSLQQFQQVLERSQQQNARRDQ